MVVGRLRNGMHGKGLGGSRPEKTFKSSAANVLAHKLSRKKAFS